MRGFSLRIVAALVLAVAPGVAWATGDAEPPVDLELRGTLHVRFQDVNPMGTPESELRDRERDGLLLRRARLQASLRMQERALLVLEADFAEPDAPLRDAYFRYRFWRSLDATVGHFKRPFSALELESIWDLLPSERGLVSERLRGWDLAGRSVGLMVSGKLRRLGGLRYAAGLFDDPGDDIAESLAARLTISKGPLTIGAGVSYANPDAGTGVANRLRLGLVAGGDVTLERGPLLFRIEGFYGKNRQQAYEGLWGHFAGGYTLVAVRLRIPNTCVTLEPGLKAELLDLETTISDDHVVLVTPLVRANLGEHVVALAEGNLLVAADRVPEGFATQTTFVLQIGARL